MGTNFLSPEVDVQELPSNAVAVRQDSPSVTAMETTATRGPVNTPVTVTGPDDYLSVYGGDDGGDGLQSATMFFDNGGARLVVNRVAHYTDITDAATLTAVSADIDLNTSGTAATVATKTSTSVETWDVSTASGITQPPELIVSVDGGGPDTATITGTPSVLTAAGVPGGIGTLGNTLIFSVKSITQTYTVPAAPPTTAADWALDIQAQIPGVFATVVGGVVVLTTDAEGSAADVDYASATGTAGVDSGFGAGPTPGVNAGPNNVVDKAAVTAAELAAILLADWTAGGGVTTSVVAGAVKVDTVAMGSAASIGPVSGSASTIITWPGGTVTGADSGSPTVLTLETTATSQGEHGNLISMTVLRTDRVAALVTTDVTTGAITQIVVDSAAQLRVGHQIFMEDTVTSGELRAIIGSISGTTVTFNQAYTLITGDLLAVNSPTVTTETVSLTELVSGEVTRVAADLSMSPLDVSFYVESVWGSNPTIMDPRFRTYVTDADLVPSATVDPRPVDVVSQILTGGLNGDPVVDNDYVGSSVSKLGLNAYDSNVSFSMLMIPGINTSTTQRAGLAYADGRQDHVFFMDAPDNLTPAQVVTYKNVTANLFSTYAYMSVPHLQVVRQSTGVVESFPAAAAVTGSFARNDLVRNVSLPAAGIEMGKIVGAVGVSRNNEYEDKGSRDTVSPEGINSIRSRPGFGILTWGQNTLNPSSDRGAIGVRRAFIFLREGIENLSEFVLFFQNTTTLRADWRKRATAYLRLQRTQGIIQGETDGEAFFVVCDGTNNDETVVNARQFKARVGVNVLPGTDFVLIDIERDTRALDAELSA